MFTQCYSNLTEKKDKKGALIYVLAIVFQSAQQGKSMAEYILGRGVLFNTNAVF